MKSYFCIRFLYMLWILHEILVCVHSAVLPTIMLNPWNPVFSCEAPLIHVLIHDQISFGCSPKDFQYYLQNGNDKTSQLYESLYFLGTNEHAYNTCNATGAIKVIECDPIKPTVRNIAVRGESTGPDSIPMRGGQTYYFIDTAFRTQQQLNNLVGGSCNTTDKVGQYKIRLQVYVCSHEDDAAGKCEPCRSEACFYKDCQKNCTNWKTISESIEDKLLVQTRNCTNLFLNENHLEYQTISANESRCQDWIEISSTQNGNNCTYYQKQVCINSDKRYVTQFREVTKECPPPNDVPTAAPRTQNSDNSNTYGYVAIGSSIFCFIVGLVIGVLIQRRKRISSNNNLEMNGNILHKDGIANEGFDNTDSGKGSL